MNRTDSYTGVEAGEEIVISGISGRFPNTNSVKELQENLMNKMDLGSSDHRRWPFVYDMPNRIGVVNNLEKFDSQFFDIPTIRAHLMDPSDRILLELTYEAIIDAGMNPKELQGTRTSVITAICTRESIQFSLMKEFKGVPVIGGNNSFAAHNISSWLNLTGPSLNFDAACSTSELATIKAYELMRSGECDAAIIAASNLCISPLIQLQFYRLGVLSSTGYCYPFDKQGSGYMRSDTIAVVYMQKAKDARRIYATCIHGKVNCDGFKEEGITYPSYKMQKTLLEEVYEECGFPPHKLNYVEAHATATMAGDPVEIMSIDHALCAERNTPLLTGSIKSNLGHSEPASSFCQFAKVLIAMETGVIPPTIGFEHSREALTAIIEGRIKIVTEPTEWEGGYVGVNSFGFGGSNCHILLKSNPKQKINNGAPSDDLPRLVVVSGSTAEAVKIILDDVSKYCNGLFHIFQEQFQSYYI